MRGIDELDHYELLEVSRGANKTELDRAYRTAQQTYADGSLALYSVFEQTDAAAIRERLDEAYRVLSDPELRALYDEQIEPIERVSAASATAGGLPAGYREGAHHSEASYGSDDRGFHDRAMDAATSPGPLDGFDPVEQLGTVEEAVEEFDAIEDDGRGEFDGVRLRRNRLFRGYELDDISDVTKVSSAHLRNIEEENFLDLPADVYVRGFVTAYAQTIGLDPKVVVPSYMARVQESRSDTQRGRFLGRR